MSARVYTRKFDYDEARARYAAGESIAALAEEYAVHRNMIRRVVSPAVRLSYERYQKSLKTKDSCERCGAPKSRFSRYVNGSRLCISCAADDKVTTVRPDSLRCVTCKEWKPDEAFSTGARFPRRRGRRSECTACGTVARRDYRRRHREQQAAYDREYKRRRRAAA